MTQNELAQFLGISAPMVSKLKQQGMPVHSVFAAREWRMAHLDPALLKECRRPELCGPLPGRDPVVECNELGVAALEALDRGDARRFVERVEALRAVMKTLTTKQEDGVLLDVDVWDALCGQPGRWSSSARHSKG